MIDQTTTTRKRQNESDDANDVKRKDINDRRSTVEHTDVRFDFLVEK